MLVQTEDQFQLAFSTMLDADVLVIDTETYYITPGVPTLQLGIAVYCPVKGTEMDVSFYFPFRHEHNATLFGDENLPMEKLRELKVAIEREDCTLIFHNAKFDLAVLGRDNIHPKQFFYDTMLMSHMLDENSSNALKSIAKERWGIDNGDAEKQIKALAKTLSPDGKIASGWALIPPAAMAIYAEKDVELTYRLWEEYQKEMEQQELDGLWEREMEFCRLLMDMESTGVLIDQEQAQRLARTCFSRREEIQSSLGFDPMKPDQLARKLFGPEPSGLGFLVQAVGEPSKSYPSGRPVMDKHTLMRMNHPVADTVLEYRGLVKAESTWFNGFLEVLHPDGRVHPDFRQHGTVTTRLSCSGPNMQQLPRVDDDDPENAPMRSKVKSIITAPEGFEVWEYDYSQLEPRLATCYSRQPELVAVWKENRDFYQEIADTLSITRYQAKQLMLAIMYGAGKAKTAEMLMVDQHTSSEIVDEFWSKYPLLGEAVGAATRAAQERGFIKLWTGRRRHFRWPSEHHKAFNSAMQGGGAEIVKESGLRLRKELPELKIISQVHDSYWFEIKKDVPFVHEEIKRIMEWPGEQFFVPFPVEAKKIA